MMASIPSRVTSSSGYSVIRARHALSSRSSFSALPAVTLTNPEHARWYILHGFSPFASRVDLELILGSVKPLKVDPLVDEKLYPVGKYGLYLPPATAVTFRETLREKYGKRLFLTDRYLVKPWQRSSYFDISNNTVRCSGMLRDLTIDALAAPFEKFDVRKDGFVRFGTLIQELTAKRKRPWNVNPKLASTFLIQFESAMEAERATLELDGTLIDRDMNKISMFWYHG
eukprot:gene5770-6354_t